MACSGTGMGEIVRAIHITLDIRAWLHEFRANRRWQVFIILRLTFFFEGAKVPDIIGNKRIREILL